MMNASQSGSIWLRALRHTVALRDSVGGEQRLTLQRLEMSNTIPRFPELHVVGLPFITLSKSFQAYIN